MPGAGELANMIRDELAVGDDSYHATPEAMRVALLAVLDVPMLTSISAPYLIGEKLGLIRRSADVDTSGGQRQWPKNNLYETEWRNFANEALAVVAPVLAAKGQPGTNATELEHHAATEDLLPGLCADGMCEHYPEECPYQPYRVCVECTAQARAVGGDESPVVMAVECGRVVTEATEQAEPFQLNVGDRVEFSSLKPEWRDGTVASVNPLRVRADDTDNLMTEPAAVRPLLSPQPVTPATPTEPRVWREGDEPPPLDVKKVRHSNSQVFTRTGPNGWRAGVGRVITGEQLVRRLHGYTLTEVVVDGAT